MRNRILIYLSYKSLWSHRLRAILTMIGVTIGISSIIFLVSLGYGLEQLVTNQVANFNAFTIIDVSTPNPKLIKIDQLSLEKVKNFDKVESVGMVTNLAGRIKKSDGASAAETVIISGDNDYWNLAEIKVDQGELPIEKLDIVVNKSAVSLIGEDISTIIGKTVKLSVIVPAEIRVNPDAGLKTVEDMEFKVTGLTNDDTSPVILMTPELLNENEVDKASALKVKVRQKDKDVITETRSFLESMGYKTTYVGDTVSEISQFFSLFRVVLGAFGLIALIVASLGTFNTLTISLLERIREVGLMKALGMRNRDIYKLFLIEALIIGLAGGVFGLFLGLLTGQVLNLVLRILAMRSHVEVITLFVTPWLFSLIVAAFSVFLGFITGWYPAKRAVKIDPLDALRYE